MKAAAANPHNTCFAMQTIKKWLSQHLLLSSSIETEVIVLTVVTDAEPPNPLHVQTRAKPVATVQHEECFYYTPPEPDFPVPIAPQIVCRSKSA
jgi:hypothetical protein